jgi:hypothetical protein
MTNDKDQISKEREPRESEIFCEPPGSGNYRRSIGAAQGIELFSGVGQARRARPAKREASRSRPEEKDVAEITKRTQSESRIIMTI